MAPQTLIKLNAALSGAASSKRLVFGHVIILVKR